MSKWFLVGLVLVAGCEPEGDFYDTDIAALVEVCSIKDSRGCGCGTGFFVSENQILTANHVANHIWEGCDLVIYGTDKTISNDQIINVKQNYVDDIALITVDSSNNNWLEFCSGADWNDDIYVADFDDDTGDVYISTGRIWMTFAYFRDWIRTTARVDRGASGSPIIDYHSGCVKGLAKARTLPDKEAMGPSVKVLREFVFGRPGSRDSQIGKNIN